MASIIIPIIVLSCIAAIAFGIVTHPIKGGEISAEILVNTIAVVSIIAPVFIFWWFGAPGWITDGGDGIYNFLTWGQGESTGLNEASVIANHPFGFWQILLLCGMIWVMCFLAFIIYGLAIAVAMTVLAIPLLIIMVIGITVRAVYLKLSFGTPIMENL